MTGWKDWQIGEVVTESDFQNLVQDQVVQRYADASTRTSTLGTAIAEGMVSYLEDTNKVEVYDGSSWVQVGQEGDITSVTAGTGLTGGGTAGDVTLNADYSAIGSAITVDQTQVTGLTTGTAGQLVVSAGTAGVTYEDAEATLVAGTAGYTALSNGTAGITYQPVSHNYIINGAFDIWQRGTSFSNPTNGSFAADRLYLGVGGTPTDVTVSQQTFSANELNAVGFGDAKYYVRLAIVDKGSMSVFNFRQYIEDVRTLAGQEVTFSFWAKADSARDVRIDLKQNFGSGGSSEVTYAGSTQALSTSWQRYSFNYSLNDLSGKTIGTGDKLYFVFELDESNGATYDIWGVQLEAGSVATPFKRHAPSLQGELAACQRYYQSPDTSPSTTMIYSGTSSGGFIPNAYSNYRFPTQMRATPTITFYAHDGTAGAVSLYVSGSPIKSTSVASIGASPWGWSGNFAGNSPSWSTNADSGMLAFGFKAEAEL